MIPVTEKDAIDALLNPQPEVEAEVRESSLVVVMSTPPGPLKSNSRLWYTGRCPSGPFEDDGEGDW